MATAAEAATEAASAPAETSTETTEVVSGQVDQESAPAAAPAKPQVSEVVRLAREKRALERKVAELTARPAPAEKPALTKEGLVAELRKQYEADPEAFLEEVAGEDFVTLASRLAKREETAKAPASKIEKLEKELSDLRKQLDGEMATKGATEAKAAEAANVAMVAKTIEDAKGDDGEPLYPTLTTLDQDALDEPVAVTAYQAVVRAFDRECREGGKPDGKVLKRWSEEEQRARFHAAFRGLDKHYAKIRTPKSPSPPRAQEPEPSPTISKNNSGGHADQPVKRAQGTMTRDEALRQALKEHGYQQ